MHYLETLFRHWFTPREENGHKPKLLHHEVLTIVVVLLLLVNLSLKSVAQKQWSSVLGVSLNITVSDLVKYTNEERAQHGLPPLSQDSTLANAANQKANHMLTYNYWSHFAPDGTSPWSFLTKSGYTYTLAGENLAKDFSDSRSVIDAWMNSEKHRENILQSQYKHVAFAIKEGVLQGKPTVLVIQLFATPDSSYTDTHASRKTDSLKEATATSPIKTIASTSGVVRSAKVNSHALAKRISIAILALLIIALSFDLYVLQKKGFARSGAHSYAHLVVIVIIIIGIITINPGNIL